MNTSHGGEPEPVLSPEDGPRAAALFASFAQKKGLLARATPEQLAEYADVFLHGYACGAGKAAGEAQAARILKAAD